MSNLQTVTIYSDDSNVSSSHNKLQNSQASQEKPKLSLVLTSGVTLEQLAETFKKQRRECWICSKVVSTFEAGKKIGEDDLWHLETCVLSWENLFPKT
ncbi:hypothetical protein HYY75_03755 [bacterium]|nr:hypothetical protein [bacterium]